MLHEAWHSQKKDSVTYYKYVSKLNDLDSGSIELNDTLKLYRSYSKFQLNYMFSFDFKPEIQELFRDLYYEVNKSQIKSIVYIRALKSITYYYRSVDRIEYLLELIEIANASSHLLDDKDSFELLSMMYYETFQYEKAIEKYQNRYSTVKGDPLNKISLLNNIGLSYFHLGQLKLAEDYFNKSILDLERLVSDTNLINHKVKLGLRNYMPTAINDFRNTLLENLRNIDDYNVSDKETLTSLLDHARVYYSMYNIVNVDVFYDIAYIYSQQDQYELSNVYLDSIVNNFRRPEKHSNLKLKVNKLRVFNNLKLGKIDEALSDLRLDSKPNYKSKKILAHRKFQQKEFDKEKELIDSNNRQNRLLVISLFSIALLFITYVTYNIWRRKRLQQKKAEYRQQQMISIKEESSLMLKEADHRIMNSIQLAANMASLEKMKGEKDFDVQALQLKMMSIAEIHKLIYKEDIHLLSTEEYIEEIIHLLKSSLSFQGGITFNIVEESKLNVDTLKNIGLVLIELIINTIKHASEINQSEVCIDIDFNIKSAMVWTIDYRDNGRFNYSSFKTNSNYHYSMVSILIQSLTAHYQIQDLPHFNIRIYKP